MKNYDCKQCKVAAERSIFLTNLVKKLGFRGKKRTMEATVISKRFASARFPTQGSAWDHWVKFALADGTETEIITPEAIFRTLSPGEAGVLTWEGESFLSFDRKE